MDLPCRIFCSFPQTPHARAQFSFIQLGRLRHSPCFAQMLHFQSLATFVQPSKIKMLISSREEGFITNVERENE